MSTNHNIHSFLKKHGIKNTIIRYDLSREELQKICLERELGIEDRNTLSTEEYDELIEDYIASGNPIVRLYDRETKEPKEYYDKKVLLTTVSRKKESTWAMLFPEEGWIEAGEMGWFGISSLDTMDLKEREQVIQDQNKLTDNLIEKYKDTHVGIIVDCHI